MVKIFSIAKKLTSSDERLAILTYHRVLAEPDPLLEDELDAEIFSRQMEILAKNFNVLSLDEGLSRLQAGELPVNSVCITFDDGYENNYSVALPILNRWRLPATIFVATDFINGGIMWNDMVVETVRQSKGDILDLSEFGLEKYDTRSDKDRKMAISSLLGHLKYLPHVKRKKKVEEIYRLVVKEDLQDIMMNWDQIEKLSSRGIEVGAHTESHPILTSLSEQQSRTEIINSRDKLKNSTKHDIKFFAYPNGKPDEDFNETHIKILKDAGFIASVTTSFGSVCRHSDYMRLPRIAPWNQSTLSFIAQVFRGYKYGDPS